MKKAVIHLLDIILWGVFAFYLWGGISIQERAKFTFIKDLTLGAGIGIFIFYLLFGISVLQTTFGKSLDRAFQAVTQWQRQKSLPDRRDLGSWIVLGGGIYLFALFLILPIVNHFQFGTHAFDFGIYQNVVFNGSRSGSFYTHFLIREEGPTLYFPNNRLDFGILLFAPLYKLWAWPGWLLLAQSLALLLPLVALYRLGGLLLPSFVPRWLPLIAYWCFDPIHRMNSWDWHETPFAIPFGLFALYFIERGARARESEDLESYKNDRIWAMLNMVWMAMWRDDLWISFAAFSGFAALRTRDYRFFGIAGILGLCVLPIHFKYFNTVHTIGERYPYLGETGNEAVHTLLTRPWILLQVAWENRSFFLRLFLASGGALFLFSGRPILALIPALGLVGLSKWEGMLSWTEHYIGLFTAPLFFATLVSWGKILRWNERIGKVAITGACAMMLSQLAASEPGWFTHLRASKSYADCLDRLAALVPPDAPLLAADPFAAKLSNREYISLPFKWIHITPAEFSRIDQTRATYLAGSDFTHLKAGLTDKFGKRDPSVGEWEIIKQDCGGPFIAKRKAPQNFPKN